MSDGTRVRAGTIDDAAELSRLKVAFAGGTGDAPAEFAARLAEWIDQQADALVVRVAEHRGRLVGMAWLVVYERVPNQDATVRRCADVQSVFVAPEHRRRGVGRRLVAALCSAADDLGVARTTVHSSQEGRSLYLRCGFADDALLLGRDRGATGREP